MTQEVRKEITVGKLLRGARNMTLGLGALGSVGHGYRRRAEVKCPLSGQTVLAAGAGSGLGRLLAIGAAQRLAAHVVVWDIQSDAAAATVEQIHSMGVDASYDVVDLASDESVDAGGKAVRQRIGGIDFLINNAGVVTGKPFLEQSHDDVTGTFQVNTLALYRVTRSEEHTSELQSRGHLVCRLLLEKKNTN